MHRRWTKRNSTSFLAGSPKEQGDGEPDNRQSRQRSLHPHHRLQPDQRNRKETFDRGEQIPDRFDHKNVHRRDDLTARRGKRIEADRYPRQILPADSERQENYYRANTLASQRYP